MPSIESENTDADATAGMRRPRKLQAGGFMLFLEAYVNLIRFDLYIRLGSFEQLYNKVRDYRTNDVGSGSIDEICGRIDMACVWYWKEALCLQRSAAAVCLLRKHGIPAQLVIGVRQMPFKSHAWVEVEGRVVNDNVSIP